MLFRYRPITSLQNEYYIYY